MSTATRKQLESRVETLGNVVQQDDYRIREISKI